MPKYISKKDNRKQNESSSDSDFSSSSSEPSPMFWKAAIFMKKITGFL